MKNQGSVEKKTSQKRGKKSASGKSRNAKDAEPNSPAISERGMLKIEKSRQLSSSTDDILENHIVPLEPTHDYILRDFLRTNNMLNQSMSVLNEQNKQNIKDWEGEKDNAKRRDILDKAAHDTRTNALALAAVVQAKVQYIKAVKGYK